MISRSERVLHALLLAFCAPALLTATGRAQAAPPFHLGQPWDQGRVELQGWPHSSLMHHGRWSGRTPPPDALAPARMGISLGLLP